MRELAYIREAAYRFLALVFLYPEATRVAKLTEVASAFAGDDQVRQLAFWSSWESLCARICAVEDDSLVSLGEEYVVLFGVSGYSDACSPCASWYLGADPSAGSFVDELSREYRAAGVVTAGPEPPDHISVQLEFASLLVAREQEEWELESTRAIKFAREECDFVRKYLAPWVPAFCGCLRQRARGGLYSDAADALDSFIQHEVDLTAVIAGLPEQAVSA